VKPRWDAKEFPKEPVTDQLKPLVTGFNDPNSNSLKIYQDATIFCWKTKSRNSNSTNYQGTGICFCALMELLK